MIITKIVYLMSLTMRYTIFFYFIRGVFIMEHYYTNNPTTKSCEKIISSKSNIPITMRAATVKICIKINQLQNIHCRCKDSIEKYYRKL